MIYFTCTLHATFTERKHQTLMLCYCIILLCISRGQVWGSEGCLWVLFWTLKLIYFSNVNGSLSLYWPEKD